MTALGGLIGFGVVFLIVAVGMSALLCAAVALLGPALTRRGPALERRAIELAVVLPIAVAALVVAALVAHSATAADHCPSHGHHAHLCVAHAGAWLDRPWAVAIASAALVVWIGRAFALTVSVVRGRARVRVLARVATAVDDVSLIDSPRAFCFVAGVRRPTIYASTTAWRGLADDERAAMLAHERAHVRDRDVARRLLLDVATVLAAPLAPSFLGARWDAATERLRDADAATETAPDAVARALVAMARLGAVRIAGASFEAGERAIAVRVEALLAEGPTGLGAARRLGAVTAAFVVGLAAAIAVSASSLHHALETLLG